MRLAAVEEAADDEVEHCLVADAAEDVLEGLHLIHPPFADRWFDCTTMCRERVLRVRRTPWCVPWRSRGFPSGSRAQPRMRPLADPSREDRPGSVRCGV